MKGHAPFRIIPELVGDFVKVIKLSENPGNLYIDTAMETLRLATSLYSSINERRELKKAVKNKETVEEDYRKLEEINEKMYIEKRIQELQIEYTNVQGLISDGMYGNQAVKLLIDSIQEELKRAMEIFGSVKVGLSFAEQAEADEMFRRLCKDYNYIAKLNIQEENL